MKHFFLFFLLINMTHSWAMDGIIIVLEAPLLKSPDLSSQVVQTLRKGERVYVPREVARQEMLPEFIPTFDRTGNRAYIPTKFVKMITNDTTEERQPITLAGHDPTDYRLEEPIPATYPFADGGSARASLAFMAGNSSKSPYNYNSAFNKQDYRAEMGGRLMLTKKVDHDNYDRFYFGLLGILTNSANTIEFKNENVAEESRALLRAGPYFTFDAYKNEKYRLALGSGFTFNYHKTTLMIENSSIGEERLFSGFSISPVVSTIFQATEFFSNIDLIGGVDFSLFLPYTQKTVDEPEYPQLWSENNQITSGLKSQVSLFFGLQAKY